MLVPGRRTLKDVASESPIFSSISPNPPGQARVRIWGPTWGAEWPQVLRASTYFYVTEGRGCDPETIAGLGAAAGRRSRRHHPPASKERSPRSVRGHQDCSLWLRHRGAATSIADASSGCTPVADASS